MDPLTVTVAVLGLLKALPSVATTIEKFIHDTRQAPHQAQVILTEVDAIRNILSQLQAFIVRRTSEVNSQAAYVQVEQVLATLTDCVLTVSELEQILNGLKLSNQGALDRVRWVRKEPDIANIVQRLQNHKLSLTCMLTIMNGNTTESIEDSVSRLSSLVERMLASNQSLASRMRSLEQQSSLSRAPTRNSIDSITSSITVQNTSGPSSFTRRAFQFTFDRDLKASRVYRKICFSRSSLSLRSTDAPSASWSFLSGLSMADVSNISVLTLPISIGELSNGDNYTSESPPEVFALAIYNFTPEPNSGELDLTAGEVIVIEALGREGNLTDCEWVLAKPIGRLGGPGWVPLSFLVLKDLQTGNTCADRRKIIQEAGIPPFEEYIVVRKRYKDNVLLLGGFRYVSSGIQGSNNSKDMRRPTRSLEEVGTPSFGEPSVLAQRYREICQLEEPTFCISSPLYDFNFD